MANNDIRKLIKEECLTHWQVADRLNISESTLVRKLRKELSEEEKQKIKNAIYKEVSYGKQ